MAAQVGEPPTVATDETDQPSTSAGINATAEAEREDDTSDSDASIDYAEFEFRKDVYVKKMVLCEQFFNKMKTTLKYTRLKGYDRRKEAVKNRTDPEYLSRVAAMEKEMQKERDKEKILYDLEKAALERDHEGELDMVKRGYKDWKQYRKSESLYRAQLKSNTILERIMREDQIRSDVRIFVGEDIPDEWMDEFVKAYVDELEAHEKSEEVVKEKNRRRYRKEAGESLDNGRPLSSILDRATANGRWGPRCALYPRPQWMYDEKEKMKEERWRRKKRKEMIENRVMTMSHKNFGRFFATKARPAPVKSVSVLPESFRMTREDRAEMEDYPNCVEDERMDEEFIKKMENMKRKRRNLMRRMDETRRKMAVIQKTTTREPEVITLKDPEVVNLEEGDEGGENPQSRKIAVPMRRKNGKRQRTKREEQRLKALLEELRQFESDKLKLDGMMERLEELEELREEQVEERKAGISRVRLEEADDSDESSSDDDEQDLETTLRQGVRAVLMTQGQPDSELSDRRKKRMVRLKSALTEVLDMKRKWNEDPELAQVQNSLMDAFGGMRMEDDEDEESEDSDLSDEGEHPMHDMDVEGQVRETSFVRGLVNRSVERSMVGPWIDIEGRARGAIESVRERKERLQELFAVVKKEQRRIAKGEEVESGDEDERRRYWMEKEMYKNMEAYSIEEEVEEGGESNGITKEVTEEERAEKYKEKEKEKKLRDIRALMEGRNPNEIEEEASPEVEVEEEEDDEDEEGEDEEEEEEEEELKIVDDVEGGECEREDARNRLEQELDIFRRRRKKNARKRRVGRYDKGDDEEEEEYGRKQKWGYGEVHGYRLAERPKPRMKLQLSEERIMRDLFRSGALRNQQSYGDHLVQLDKERSQFLLETLPSTSSGRDSIDLAHLLSPRSRMALEEMPVEAVAGLTKREKEALLETLPSGGSDESDEDEELSEGWELEEDVEKRKAAETVEQEERMEVDEVVEEVKEEMEETRGDEMVEFSPPSAVGASPLLHEPSTTAKKKKKSAQRMNGFSRTGTAAAS